ncbi:MAG TPA: beta-ketoacyl synthase N-terminal-like domain-containing protein [Kofleriaceae bacterium]|jgi:acyl transferase domain-containing protein/acyl-CoA synthetase (AMP-forming)/AMP-acid ligase II
MNIMEWADRQQTQLGELDALVADGKTWTSAQLHDEACRLASGLIALGITPGVRIVLWMANTAELVIGFTAVVRAGAAAVIVSDVTAVPELVRIVAHCEATTVITTAALAATAGAALTIRVLDERALRALISDHAPLATPVSRGPDDIAQIVYTSGTTGQPKGVVWTHGTVDVRYSPFAEKRAPTAKPRRHMCALPMAAAFGSQYLYLRLLQKMTLVLLERFSPDAFLAAVERYKIEAAWLVPSMCEALLALPDAPHDVSSLGSLLVGGSTVSSSLVDRFKKRFGVRITTIYGLTELGPVASTSAGDARGDVGKLRDGMRVRVLGPTGIELAAGDVGEIELFAGQMRAQYYQAAEPTDEWFRTGDVGYVSADGALRIVGRSKDIIIQGGTNVHPQQVVEAIRRLDGVADCAVVGVPDPFLGEAVVACVVRAPGAAIDADAVLAHCRANLDRRRAPVRVQFFAALPRNELGKVRVLALQEAIATAQAAVVETQLVRAVRAAVSVERIAILRRAVEAQLAAILGVPVPPDDESTFGQLGLDSMGAVQLAASLGDALGRRVPATLTFNHPTIARVCEHLLGELIPTSETPSIAPTRRNAVANAPIAVIGFGVRLSGGARDEGQLWDQLRDKLDASAEITRWDVTKAYREERGAPGKTYTRRASLLDNIDLFDAEFFGLSAREAKLLDPQHRFVLEVTWEALENAGYDPRGLANVPTGLFLGISGSTYISADPLGTAPSMAPGRVSHFLDLHGPALAIDTTCSSSLVAVHTAVQSLRLGETDLAIAGGVNLICSVQSFIGLSQIQALASDGRCKAFDAAADGFGRGEGCVMIALKRLDEAQTDGDRVIAVIRGSAINHDGKSASLTAPNGKAQEAVFRAALADAGVAPRDVDYLEAHGTGTAIGDPIEVQAAMSVLGERPDPVVMGSVKANLGHLEAAAGALGVLKASLVLAHGEVPPHPTLHELNPTLAPLASRFVTPTELTSLPSRGRPRIASVMSMGMSGTNASAILEQAPLPAARERPTGDADADHLLVVSARTEDALRAQLAAYAAHLDGFPERAVGDACFTASVGRSHFRYRASLVGKTAADLRAKLLGREYATRRISKQKIAFLFTGQGSQYVGMGKQLYDAERVFRASLQRCAEILAPVMPRPLLDALFTEPRAGELPIDDTSVTQPALFAFGWSLAELWKSWGIEPDLVLGHSLGEYMAACAAGVISVEDGLRFVAERGRLMATAPNGAMAQIGASEAAVREILDGRTDVQIGALNGPTATVIAGVDTAVLELVNLAQGRGLKARRLPVSTAFHSALMDPILDPFEAAAAKIAFSTPRLPLVSTVTGQRATADELATTVYWRRGLREAVQFRSAIDTACAEGVTTFVEIGASPILIGMARTCVPDVEARSDLTWVPSLTRDTGNRASMLDGLGGLYLTGAQPRWDSVHAGRDRRRVALPTYQFQRRRFWDPANPRPASSVVDPSPVAAPPPHTRELFDAAAPTDRPSLLIEHVARIVASVTGSSESLSPDDDLLEAGVDSLRAMRLLADLKRSLGFSVAIGDFMARPTLRAFADYLAGLLAPTATAPEVSPLVSIRADGRLSPLYCFHPAGGHAAPYLRLRGLLSADQPIFALQSRALGNPEREHESISAMAADYAAIVHAAHPAGPLRLLGWSLGGLVAHAVGAELERRGRDIELVGMIDVPDPANGIAIDALTLAVTGITYDVNPDPPEPAVIARALRELTPAPPDLHAWCEARGLLPPGRLDRATFDAAAELYRRHHALVRSHVPPTIRAPLALWWAERASGDWSTRGGRIQIERVLGGTHYTIVRSPLVDAIAADLGASER